MERNMIKDIYKNSKLNIIILSGERLSAFTIRLRHRCLLSPLLVNIVLKIPARASRQEKKTKDILKKN